MHPSAKYGENGGQRQAPTDEPTFGRQYHKSYEPEHHPGGQYIIQCVRGKETIVEPGNGGGRYRPHEGEMCRRYARPSGYAGREQSCLGHHSRSENGEDERSGEASERHHKWRDKQ